MGDGDFGMSIAKGFRQLKKEWATRDKSDIGAFLRSCSEIIMEYCGGASGPIWGSAFRYAGKAADGKDEITLADLADIFQAANKGVYETGKKSFGKGAVVGDKTLVDALKPCADALEQAAKGRQVPPRRRRRSAREAAVAGAEKHQDRRRQARQSGHRRREVHRLSRRGRVRPRRHLHGACKIHCQDVNRVSKKSRRHPPPTFSFPPFPALREPPKRASGMTCPPLSSPLSRKKPLHRFFRDIFLTKTPAKPLTKVLGSNILISLCGHGGTGRRVRLRGRMVNPVRVQVSVAAPTSSQGAISKHPAKLAGCLHMSLRLLFASQKCKPFIRSSFFALL